MVPESLEVKRAHCGFDGDSIDMFFHMSHEDKMMVFKNGVLKNLKPLSSGLVERIKKINNGEWLSYSPDTMFQNRRRNAMGMLNQELPSDCPLHGPWTRTGCESALRMFADGFYQDEPFPRIPCSSAEWRAALKKIDDYKPGKKVVRHV